jgi:hypothetical protein
LAEVSELAIINQIAGNATRNELRPIPKAA